MRSTFTILETLMSQIYTIPEGNMFYLCGDWNSRCSDFPDFIEGVDNLPERNVVDYQHNSYGTIFCDFLIDVNCCILNGRNMVHNDYTFVSTRGCSVVDYCITPYELLDSFTDFSVLRITDMIQSIGVADKFDLRKAMPDHSLLTWTMHFYVDLTNIESNHRKESKTEVKYNTRNLPDDWLAGENIISDINDIISALEETKLQIDEMYDKFISVIKEEMSQKLQQKTVS